MEPQQNQYEAQQRAFKSLLDHFASKGSLWLLDASSCTDCTKMINEINGILDCLHVRLECEKNEGNPGLREMDLFATVLLLLVLLLLQLLLPLPIVRVHF